MAVVLPWIETYEGLAVGRFTRACRIENQRNVGMYNAREGVAPITAQTNLEQVWFTGKRVGSKVENVKDGERLPMIAGGLNIRQRADDVLRRTSPSKGLGVGSGRYGRRVKKRRYGNRENGGPYPARGIRHGR